MTRYRKGEPAQRQARARLYGEEAEQLDWLCLAFNLPPSDVIRRLITGAYQQARPAKGEER